MESISEEPCDAPIGYNGRLHEPNSAFVENAKPRLALMERLRSTLNPGQTALT